jgi:hypothetical protein
VCHIDIKPKKKQPKNFGKSSSREPQILERRDLLKVNQALMSWPVLGADKCKKNLYFYKNE